MWRTKENKGDQIRITDETAANSKRSVKIVDAPGLQHVYNPHYTIGVNYTKGVVSNTFDLRVEKDSNVSFEWRDYSGGAYKTGPSFNIRDGVLRTGQVKLKLPMDQWVHFEIVAKLEAVDKSKKLRWNLAITPAGQPRREFKGLLFTKSNFNKLTWMGFMSNAQKSTEFYLDNLSLESH